MTRLVLHIGMPKTGTTALQYFFAHNQARLASLGWTYSEFKGGDMSHNFLAPMVHRGDWAGVGALMSKLAGAGRPNVLVSCGPLFAFSAMRAKRHRDERLVESFETVERAAAKGLMAECRKHFDVVDVVGYLRRQDKSLESSFNQSVKNGTWRGGGIEDFYRFMRNRLSYDVIADVWASAAGQERLTLRVYDRKHLANGDIRVDFLKMIGLDPSQFSFETKGGAREENLRLCRDTFEYKAILNRIDAPRWRQHQFKRALRQVSADMGQDVTRWQDFLSPAQRAWVLADLAESNRRLSAAHFPGRGDTPFDTTDLTTPSNEVYPGLTTEKAVELHLRLTRRLAERPFSTEARVLGWRDRVAARFGFLKPLLTPLDRLFRRSG